MKIAVCPECGGNLEALFDRFKQLMKGINLYEPDMDILYCRNEDASEHQGDCAKWLDIYDVVGEWRKAQSILIEFTD